MVERGEAFHGSSGRAEKLLGTVAGIFQRKAAEEPSRRNEERLQFALLAARAGAWGQSNDDERLAWSAASFALVERDPAAGPPTTRDFYAQRHHDDVLRVPTAVADALSGRMRNFRAQYGVKHPGGGPVRSDTGWHRVQDYNCAGVFRFGFSGGFGHDGKRRGA